jgi:hypothetical protein
MAVAYPFLGAQETNGSLKIIKFAATCLAFGLYPLAVPVLPIVFIEEGIAELLNPGVTETGPREQSLNSLLWSLREHIGTHARALRPKPNVRYGGNMILPENLDKLAGWPSAVSDSEKSHVLHSLAAPNQWGPPRPSHEADSYSAAANYPCLVDQYLYAQ